MTAQNYIDAGFELTKQISDAIVLRAEKDVFDSYVKPIIGSDATVEGNESEIMALAFCLMLRRNIVKTRFSAEIKTTNYGSQLSHDNVTMMSQIAGICSGAIKSLKEKSTISEPYLVNDIIDSGYYIY